MSEAGIPMDRVDLGWEIHGSYLNVYSEIDVLMDVKDTDDVEFPDPARARTLDFDPFWEFVAGPLHAGTFGPQPLDPTFGPEVRFQRAPPPGEANLPPSAGLQFFGEINAPARGPLRVTLRDRLGEALWSTEIEPATRTGT